MTIVQPTLWGDLDPGLELDPGSGLEARPTPGTPAAVAHAPAPEHRGHDAFTALRGHTERIVAHSSDRVAWLRARAMGITATDVARLSSLHAVEAVVADKRYGSRFAGNVYT